MNTAALYLFLSSRRFGVVSSVSAEYVPQSALVGIAVTPQLEIIFDTLKSTRKYRNLVARPECSFAIGWDGEKTVQLEGTAIELSGDELGSYQKLYFSVWKDGPSRMLWPGISYFVIRPRWIRYSDFEQNPPFIEEMTFSGS